MLKVVSERFHGRPAQGDRASAEYVGGAAMFRRRLAITAIVAVTAVVAVSVALAFRQYRHAQHSDVADLRSKATVAAAVVDAYFAGDVATLSAVAKAPAFVDLDLPAMNAYLRRVQPAKGALFNGGIGWIDRQGHVKATSTPSASSAQANVRDRAYFKRTIATGRPFVSGGLIGRRLHEPLVVIAVPTRRESGRISGVLAASIRLQAVRDSKTQLDLGYLGLEILDRNGKRLLSGLGGVSNSALLARIGRSPSGAITGTDGLDGTGDHVVAFAKARVPEWQIVIDRPRSSVEAAAFHTLVLQLASVGAVALLVFALVAFVVRRSRRDYELQESRARAWTDLTRALGAAATADEVASALIASLSAAFPDSLVVVAIEDVNGGSRLTRASPGATWFRITSDTALMDQVAKFATTRHQHLALEDVLSLRPVIARSGRKLRCLDTVPLHGVDGPPIGGIALLRGPDDPLDPSGSALLEAFADQTARAFERSRRSELDHDLAVRLQLSLLPEALPEVPGVKLTGHYRAGAEGLVVGGDWYDAVRRRDGILVLCVGDVIGRGIGAATLMGRLRDAFRAHAYESASPAEVVRRMLQHDSHDEMMVTLACAALDPYSGVLAYSCAGHPPPLMVGEGTNAFTRLDAASAPPLGVADPASIREEQLTVPDRATIVLYTDGLIERRGENIDRGIDILGEIVATDPTRPISAMLADVTSALGSGTDDIAFLVARLTGEVTPIDVEVPADPTELAALRRRLRAWFSRRGLDRSESEEILLAVSEALNNSIEHAYGDERGSVWLRIDDDGETVRASIRDRGRWRPGESGTDRGRGIVIMRAVMDRARIDSTEEGTEVVLERRRRTSAQPAPV